MFFSTRYDSLRPASRLPSAINFFKSTNETQLGYQLQDFHAKLSDFGLARNGPTGDKTHVSTRVVGTRGYAAPEYIATGYIRSLFDLSVDFTRDLTMPFTTGLCYNTLFQSHLSFPT